MNTKRILSLLCAAIFISGTLTASAQTETLRGTEIDLIYEAAPSEVKPEASLMETSGTAGGLTWTI